MMTLNFGSAGFLNNAILISGGLLSAATVVASLI
jgi:hypothetical protein